MTNIKHFPRAAFVGFDHLFDELERMTAQSANSYPPHNVVKLADDHYAIELAAAGFKEEELEIELKDGMLHIRGDHKSQGREYLHKGISARKFDRSFRLSEYVNVNGAYFRDGLLVIDLKVVLPEEKRPRIIPIGKQSEVITHDNSSTTEPELLMEESKKSA
jgi:molecular chaperone IbpA